jgi:ligand-binding sensor protein
MADSGRLPSIKVGRQWRFPADQVEEWLAAQSVPVVSPLSLNNRDDDDLLSKLPVECVQLIQDTFAKALGVMVIITDMDGRPVTELSNPCGLFEALSNTPALWQRCIDHWRDMAVGLSLEPRFDEGYLGLLCSRAYIRTGSVLSGMVFIGGIAPDNWPPSPEKMREIAADLDVDFTLFTNHVEDVYRMNEIKQAHVLSLIQPIADVVSHILNERIVLMRKLDQIGRITAV